MKLALALSCHGSRVDALFLHCAVTTNGVRISMLVTIPRAEYLARLRSYLFRTITKRFPKPTLVILGRSELRKLAST
jgi:hypothetical protein